MKIVVQVCHCLLVLAASIVSCYASPVPSKLENLLEQRENSLKNTTFMWRQSANLQTSSLSPVAVAHLQKNLRRNLSERLKSQGLSDARIHSWVQQETSTVPANEKGFVAAYSTTWRFQCYRNQMLVTGSQKVSLYDLSQYTQFYSGSDGLQIDQKEITGAGKYAPTTDPDVWNSPGDSFRYRSPLQEGLDLIPEHFAVLVGANPLAMYGCHWDVVSANKTSWTVKARVVEGNFAPYTITMSLNRAYSASPSTIVVKPDTLPWSIVCHVNSYQHLNNTWLSRDADFIFNAPGIRKKEQHWTLEAVKPSLPITFAAPHNRYVHDYRLIGKNLTTNAVLDSEGGRKHNIVYYVWSGHFPTLDELKGLYQKQHPGEATPDFGLSSSAPLGTLASASNVIGSAIPFAGGVLCLVGGVWMFKQRKAN